MRNRVAFIQTTPVINCFLLIINFINQLILFIWKFLENVEAVHH